MPPKRSPTPRMTRSRARSSVSATPVVDRQYLGPVNIPGTPGSPARSSEALPQVQGAGSVSYGSPGVSELPKPLRMDNGTSLADIIEDELQEAQHRVEQLRDDFLTKNQSEYGSDRESRSRSVESTESSPNFSMRMDVHETNPTVNATSHPIRDHANYHITHEMSNESSDVDESDLSEEDDDAEELSHTIHVDTPVRDSTAETTLSFLPERITHAMAVRPKSPKRVTRSRLASVSSVSVIHYFKAASWNTVVILSLIFALLCGLASYLYGVNSSRSTPYGTFGHCHNSPLCRIKHSLSSFTKPVNMTSLDVGLIREDIVAMEKQIKVHLASQIGEMESKIASKIETKVQTQISKGNGKTSEEQQIDLTSQLNEIKEKIRILEEKDKASKSVEPPTSQNLFFSDPAVFNFLDFFAPGLGGRVVPMLTTTTFDRHPSLVQKLFKRTFGISRPHGPSMALEKSRQPGDCWCGSVGERNRSHVQISIKTRYPVWPVSLWIENIEKNRTIWYDTTPKEIEVWGRLADKRGRKVLRDLSPFSFLNMPGTADPQLGEEEWVRLATGKYRDNNSFVQQIPIYAYPELEETRIVEVLVRALSNYGNKHATCFYRLGMQGDLVYALRKEAEEVPPTKPQSYRLA